jgi:hypothetical protein
MSVVTSRAYDCVIGQWPTAVLNSFGSDADNNGEIKETKYETKLHLRADEPKSQPRVETITCICLQVCGREHNPCEALLLTKGFDLREEQLSHAATAQKHRRARTSQGG